MKISYHGGSKASILSIMSSVDVTLGSGELGLGFYTQDNKTGAVRFAIGRHGEQNSACVELDIKSSQLKNLTKKVEKNTSKGLRKINSIRNKNKEKQPCFKKDYVEYPLESNTRVTQYKFESTNAQNVLNKKNTNGSSMYFKEIK